MTDTFYQGFFPDKRLEHRGQQILTAMTQKQSAIANRYCATPAEERGSRRFLANDTLKNQQLKDAAYAFCRRQVQRKPVLAIRDSTELNYQRHAGRRRRDDPELGPVGNHHDLGFFLHPTLVVDPATDFPLGLASLHDWNRAREKDGEAARDYKHLPLEEKESYRWISSAEETKRQPPEAEHLLFIGDRESDLYEEFVRVPDGRCDVLVRCAQDRALYDRAEGWFESLQALPVAGEDAVEIRGNRQRASRMARLELRCGRVQLARPQKHRAASPLPPFVEVSAIAIREKATSVPGGEKPILWRLATRRPVDRVADAWQCARGYDSRWWIEQLFRVLKTDGLPREGSQLESGPALKRLALLALQAALQILQLTTARAGTCAVTPETVFTPEELAFQEQLGPQLEGKTAKQKNPYPRTNLAWSAWIIARLGGWKEFYSRRSPPGPITMKRGLECFYQQFAGWCIASSLH